MKGSIRKEMFQKIYRMLDDVSPVDYDCGKLCGSICCTCDISNNESDNYDMGIYLLPGEEKMFTRKEEWINWNHLLAEDYEFPESWSGKVYFIRCRKAPVCHREMRPIQCRTYPLAPHIDKNGVLHVILNMDPLPYECPLIKDRMKLNDDFIEKTYEAWSILIKDPLIRDLIEMDSRSRENERKDVMYVK